MVRSTLLEGELEALFLPAILELHAYSSICEAHPYRQMYVMQNMCCLFRANPEAALKRVNITLQSIQQMSHLFNKLMDRPVNKTQELRV